jgi:hypothetical protein
MREGSREAFQAQAAYSSQNNLEICQQKLPLALDTIDGQARIANGPGI